MGSLADALDATDGEVTDDKGTEGDVDSGANNATGDSGNSGDDTGGANATGDDISGDVDSGAEDDKNADTGDTGDDGAGDSDTDLGKQIAEMKSTQDEMAQMLRVTRRENATLRAKVGRINDSVDLETDLDEGEGGEGVKLTNIEVLQNTLTDIGQTRGAGLELMAEQMAEMNKYSDVMEVCSKVNVDTIVETAAGLIQEKDGGDIDEIMLGLEVDIWSRPNPYKYLYNVIKANHPKYANATDSKKGDSKSKVDEALENKAASSIQDMGGSGGGKGGGWTADRIDRLPENELNQVPEDVYEKYLQGILK